MDQADTSQIHNKRKHTRFVRDDIKVSIVPTGLLGMKKPIICKLVDICAAGVQLSTKEKFIQNTKLVIILQFKNEQQFKLNTKVMWKKEANHYFTDHNFKLYKGVLKNDDNPLKSVHLLESGNEIKAKYRFLNMNNIRILTFSPLNKKKHYSLIFILSDGKQIQIESHFEHYIHHIYHDYGLKFESTNDALGEHLLNTQTDLIFK